MHGHGVVGVRVEVEVRTHHVDVELVGHRGPPGGHGRGKDPGASTPPRDAVRLGPVGARLHAAARRRLEPVGLAFGASFVYAPRRSVGAAMKQSSQNVELTNYTEAMYSARESAMEQHAAVRAARGRSRASWRSRSRRAR